MAQYELEKNRFRELKYFCFQYPKWKRDLVERPLEDQVDIERAMWLIEKTARDTCNDLYEYVLKMACYDISYSVLRPPVDNYTFSYYMHKFYWLLSHRKGY